MAETHTPQQKKRRLIPRKASYTAQMAGQAVKRRFLLGQRLFFSLALVFALAACWLSVGLLPVDWMPSLRLPLFAAAAVFLALSCVLRLKYRILQVVCFFAAFLSLGAGVGCVLQVYEVNLLLNPTIVIGVTVFGLTLNTVIFPGPATAFREYLLGGIPFLLACLIVYFFPAGEVILAASGMVAVLFAFLMLHAAERSLQTYHPSEVVVAASDLVPIALVSIWHAWTGQD